LWCKLFGYVTEWYVATALSQASLVYKVPQDLLAGPASPERLESKVLLETLEIQDRVDQLVILDNKEPKGLRDLQDRLVFRVLRASRVQRDLRERQVSNWLWIIHVVDWH